jgi:hypothetical protein
MTIPRVAGKAWDLSTMSLAIVLFAGFAAWHFGLEPSSRDVIAAAAAYATVLAVLYGNIVNPDE